MAYGFISCTSDFSYLCSKNKHLAHVWRLKDVKAQRVDQVATRLPPGAELGGCQGGHGPPKILPGPPSGPPKIFQVSF